MATLAERLRHRREDLGATLDQLASWSQLSADRLREIEAGGPSSIHELEVVSRGLGVSAGAIYRGESEDPRRSVARFRGVAPEGGLEARDLRLLSIAAEVGRNLGGLLSLLHENSRLAAAREPLGVAASRLPWEHGYELGERARTVLEIPAGPIHELTSLFFDLGIHVVDLAFSRPDIEGASLWEPDSVPVILVNEAAGRATYPPSRRAILAHELCHLLHDGGEGDLETRISYATLEDPVEQRARAFAPAFLAPPSQLRGATDRGTREPRELVEEMARTWGLSFRGAAWHAKNCHLVPPLEAERLVQEGPRSLDLLDSRFERVRVEPPFELPITPSPLMRGLGARLVRAAYRAEEISAGRARELLAWA